MGFSLGGVVVYYPTLLACLHTLKMQVNQPAISFYKSGTLDLKPEIEKQYQNIILGKLGVDI